MDIIIIETPKASFQPIAQYKKQSVYFFRFDCEETEYDTIRCNETTITVKNATFEKMVSACIEVKYDIDSQLALMYNYQLSPTNYKKQMEEYQEWRSYCIESSKKFFYIDPIPTPIELLERAKAKKISELEAYDASDAVNGFDVTISGQTMSLWIDRETRADYRSSIEAAELLGRTEVKPVFGGQEVTLSVQMAKMALAQVQLYANQCYGVTEQHKAAINALETVEEVEAYDFTKGYPERLGFEV